MTLYGLITELAQRAILQDGTAPSLAIDYTPTEISDKESALSIQAGLTSDNKHNSKYAVSYIDTKINVPQTTLPLLSTGIAALQDYVSHNQQHAINYEYTLSRLRRHTLTHSPIKDSMAKYRPLRTAIIPQNNHEHTMSDEKLEAQLDDHIKTANAEDNVYALVEALDMAESQHNRLSISMEDGHRSASLQMTPQPETAPTCAVQLRFSPENRSAADLMQESEDLETAIHRWLGDDMEQYLTAATLTPAHTVP